jgi:hypothetical protein
MKTYIRGNGGITPPLSTSAVDGEWPASRPGRFAPGEIAKRPGGPQSRSGCRGEEKKLAPTGNRTPVVQPVAHGYNDWAEVRLFERYKYYDPFT